MTIVLDTNVLISGIFFSGPPHRILQAWRRNAFDLLISSPILEEYRRVGDQLAKQFRGIDIGPILHILTTHAQFAPATRLPNQICQDPDDDKFIACAVAEDCRMIVSGDKELLKVSGYQNIEVLTPRKFVENYLS